MNPSLSIREGSRDGGPSGTLAAITVTGGGGATRGLEGAALGSSRGFTATLFGSAGGAFGGGGSGRFRSSSAEVFTSAEGRAPPSRTTMFSSSFRDSVPWRRKMPVPTKAQTRPPTRMSTPPVMAHSEIRFPRLGFSSFRGTLASLGKGVPRSGPNSRKARNSYVICIFRAREYYDQLSNP